jgi:hypothetical protein
VKPEAGGETLKLTSNKILKKYIKNIINNGDENGNEMVVKLLDNKIAC